MTDHDLRHAEAMNEARRRPLPAAFALFRVAFAGLTYALCAKTANDAVLAAWGVVWIIDFGRDLLFGLTPAQGIFGCLFGLTSWVLWAAVVATAIF